MKKMILFVGLFAWFVSNVAAQSVTSAQRRVYLMDIYDVTASQADRYEAVWSSVKEKDADLRDSRLTSKDFTKARKSLIREFRQEVSSIFNEEQYHIWETCNKEIDRYHVLSNEKLVTPKQLYGLFKVERQWLDDRNAIRTGGDPQNVKHQRQADLQKALQKEICRVLGEELGQWYIDEKALQQAAIGNMDKYNATYREGERIARIDKEYKYKRKAVYAEKIKYAQKEEKLFQLDDQKAADVRSAVSRQVADRWFTITRNQLDYVLQKNYGLDKTQIARFKTAYNVYAIEEFQVLAQKKVSNAEKLQQLEEANRQFYETVRPLFAPDAYVRWQGWHQYTFERKMKQKGMNKSL